MRIPAGFLIVSIVIVPSADAQDTSAASGVAQDSAFYANLPARYTTRGGSVWQYGVTRFIRASYAPGDCPMVGDASPDGVLHVLGDLDSLQVDFHQVGSAGTSDSMLKSPDRGWHAVPIPAVKAKFKDCR